MKTGFSWRRPFGDAQNALIQWAFLALLGLLLGLNALEALNNEFESRAFPSFRYEGRLYVENAFRYLADMPFLSLFFFSDFSTSFDSAQHPLYYFHNIAAIHFIAGLVQHYTDHWGYILFAGSAVIFLIASILLFRLERGAHEKFWVLAFVAAILLSPKGLFFVPQNFFIAIILFCVIAHFVLLRHIVNAPPTRRDSIFLFAIATLAAMAETNTAILICLISIFYAALSALFSLQAGVKFKGAFVQAVYAPLLTGIPIILSRVGQFWAIYVNDLQDLYALDLEYTHQLKVAGGVSIPKAIEFYADNGLTFFGVVGNDLAEDFNYLLSYYTDEFSTIFFPLILAAAVATMWFLRRQYVLPHARPDKSPAVPDLVAFLAGYLVCFVLATFAILFLSGRSLNNIGLSEWAIFDIAVVFRAGYFVFPALVIAALLRWRNFLQNGYLNIARTGALMAVVLAGAFNADFFYVRSDPLTFKEILRVVRPNSDIITNFDIAPVAIESQSRTSMSWLVQPTNGCRLEDWDTLLKMYRVAPRSREGSGEIYLLLAYFHPYGPSPAPIKARHCLDQTSHSILYEDQNYGLYRLHQGR